MSPNAEGQVTAPEQAQEKGKQQEQEATSSAILRTKLGPIHAERLTVLSQGAAVALLLGGVLAVLTALIPLRITSRDWQMGLIGSLIANGSWMLVGLVMMHLAAMLQPRNAKLSTRIVTYRRLAAIAAAIYLLLAPLQLVMTWTFLDSSLNQRERVLTTTLREIRNWRSVIETSSSLPEMRRRMQRLPSAPAIPAEADQLPLPAARSELLRQLTLAEQRVRTTAAAREAQGPNRLEVWKQTLRGTLASLLLAVGFASGAEGLFGQMSLLQSLELVRKRSLLPAIKPRKLKFKGLRKRLHWLRTKVLPRRSSIRSSRRNKGLAGLFGQRSKGGRSGRVRMKVR